MKLIRVIQSKIVKKDNKYQVQSEKGRNLGTYDTKEQAEKRLKQVEMFKHMKKKSSILTYANLFKPFINDLIRNKFYWDIKDIDDGNIYLIIYDSEYSDICLNIDFRLHNFVPSQVETDAYSAQSDLDYYGHNAYFDDFTIDRITLIYIGDQRVNIDIPINSQFAKALYEAVQEFYRTSKEYFPD